MRTGLCDFQHRDDSPSLGRWLESDPMGFRGRDENLYRFVGDNPTTCTDAAGLLTGNGAKRLMSRITPQKQIVEDGESLEARRGRASEMASKIFSKSVIGGFEKSGAGILMSVIKALTSGNPATVLLKTLGKAWAMAGASDLNELRKILGGQQLDVHSFSSGAYPGGNGKAFANLAIYWSFVAPHPFLAIFYGRVGNKVTSTLSPEVTDHDQLEDFAFYIMGSCDKDGLRVAVGKEVWFKPK